MAKSAIGSVKRSSRRVDAQINRELKKIEKKKALDSARKELDGKRKKLAQLKKK